MIRKTVLTILIACSVQLFAGNPFEKPARRFHYSMLTQEEERRTGPSPGAALALSLVLPGTGEFYAGSKKMAAVFFGSEVLLWSVFAGFRIYGNWKKTDYEQFAVSHAGISLEGKDHDYFVALEHYDNLQDYNQAKLKERDFNALFPENAEYQWNWDSMDSRLSYEELRVASDRAYERSVIVIGGILLNHLVSAVDALRLARKAGETREEPLQMGVTLLPEGGWRMNLAKAF